MMDLGNVMVRVAVVSFESLFVLRIGRLRCMIRQAVVAVEICMRGVFSGDDGLGTRALFVGMARCW